ncbi:MAG: DNA-nicking Smr family endonuclease [Polaribacter sp.]|jgi:DNA-nicking Smr family endonuclease
MPSNSDDFLAEMQGVQQIQQDKIAMSTLPSNINKQYRQEVAISEVKPFENFLTDGDVEKVEPEEVLSFKISGLQPMVFKNLRQAKYEFDYHLDLHGYSVKQARETIFKLVSSSQIDELRCLLITHGKGAMSKQPAKLKSYVYQWLKQIEQVIAIHSALPQHGGAGSLYVLLKKPKIINTINPAKYE